MKTKNINFDSTKLYTIIIIGVLVFVLPLLLSNLIHLFHLSLYKGYVGWIFYSVLQYLVPVVFLVYYIKSKFNVKLITQPKLISFLWLILFLILYFLLSYVSAKFLVVPRSTNQSDLLSTLSNQSIIGVQIELITLSIVAPIFEELICRGLIMNSFFKNSKFGFDIILSSIIFSLLHQHQSFIVLLPYLTLGILLGILYRITGKLMYSVILHITINILLMWPLIQENILIFL